MHTLKLLLLRLLPREILKGYHWFLSWLAAVCYGNPSKHMIVVGITGTNGKSTVAYLIAKIFEEAGHKVGLTSTAVIKIGTEERLNDMKMTMPGRMWLQRILRKMLRTGCDYVIIETSSEGIIQYRHRHIHYDAAVFTNLAPEHLERHGGFENYKKAKLALFEHLASHNPKKFHGKIVPRTIVSNLDDAHAKDFVAPFAVEQKVMFSLSEKQVPDYAMSLLTPSKNKISALGNFFSIGGVDFETKLGGRFNLENCLAAIALATSYGVDLDICAKALLKIDNVPGRMEFVDEGQPFYAVIDYAPEPNSLKAIYEALGSLSYKRLIHVLGSAGGGRDVSRRPVLGQMAAEKADVVIVTNEDPYDDDPEEIIRQVSIGAQKAGKILGKNLFKVSERAEAIKKAIELAKSDDMVLFTGKGAEQAIVGPKGKKSPWSERGEVEQALRDKIARINSKAR